MLCSPLRLLAALALTMVLVHGEAFKYRHATRDDIVKRSRIPSSVRSAAKRATSPRPFPVSDCPGYTSTGTSPIAVYSNLDIEGAGYTLFNGVQSREECQAKCDTTPNCYATTYAAQYQGCFVVPNILHYKQENVFLVSVSGVTCAQNAKNIPTSFDAGRVAACCTMYRAGPDLGTSPEPGKPSQP